MKKLLITILLLGLTGCSLQPPLGADLSTSKESILSTRDISVIPVDKIAIGEKELGVDNADENSEETFIIKSDSKMYSGDNNFDMIIGVTNIRDDEWGTLKLKFAKNETINSVKKYIPINKSISVQEQIEVETKCPTKSASTTCYKMGLATTTKTITSDSWEDISLIDNTSKSSIIQKSTSGSYANKEVKYLFPKGTTFLKVNISYERSLAGVDEFFIEIFGDNGGYGLLDPLITDLLSYWKLDEQSGTRDDAASTNDLGDVNTVTYDTGKINSAAKFVNNNTEYLSINDNASLSITGDMSFSIWLKPSANYMVEKRVFQKWTHASQNSYGLTLTQEPTGDNPYFKGYFVNDNSCSGYTYKSAQLGNYYGTSEYVQSWHHIVGSYDASAGSIDFYVDGVATSTRTGLETSIANCTSPFRVGNWGAGNEADSFDGLIDEVAIWTRTLSSSEATELYNSGNGFAYPFESPAFSTTPNNDIITFE